MVGIDAVEPLVVIGKSMPRGVRVIENVAKQWHTGVPDGEGSYHLLTVWATVESDYEGCFEVVADAAMGLMDSIEVR